MDALIARIERDAESWHVTTLPQNLGEAAYRSIFQALRDRGNARAVAVQADVLGKYLGTDDIEWLAQNKQSATAISVIDRYLTRVDRAAWIERLVAEGQDELAIAAIRTQAPFKSLPISIARALGERDALAAVADKLSSFRELDEDVALALLRRNHVRAVAANLPLFPALSQRTADAMVAADPKSLPVMGFNLRKFRGLDARWKTRLVDAGFGKDVEANPESFSR